MEQGIDVPRLLLQAKSTDPDERFEAISEIGLLTGIDEVNSILIEAPYDVDPDVVAAAVDALAERGHPRARDVILRLLQHPHPRIRFRALRAAGVVDIGPHLGAAWRAMDAGPWWVHRTAGAGALARAAVVSAIPRIIRLAERAKAVHQYAAEAHLLGYASVLGDEASAERFLERLVSRGFMSRLSAAAFLERRGRVEAMIDAVGVERLRSALLAGRRVQQASRKPGYARRFDVVLSKLEDVLSPS